jgi:hypothetical protein
MKIVMVSIAFAPARVIIECYKQIYKTIGNIKFEHYVLNNHYPIDQDRNDALIKTLVESYSGKYFDLGSNVGLSEGYSYLMREAKLEPDDIVIGIDPDVWPVTPNWGEALVKVLSEPNTNIGWVSLFNHHSQREFNERGFIELDVAGLKCYNTKTAMLNSICAWKGDLLIKMGGLKEPNKYYGGLESFSYGTVKQLGYNWVFLPEYKEDFNDLVKPDLCYKNYKWIYAHERSTKLDFASWLAEDPKRIEMK